MSRQRRKPETCFYCGAPIAAKNIEREHFPFPQRFGGEVTVPVCRTCHDMKDRFALDAWPIELWSKLMSEWPALSREMRIFVVRAGALACDYHERLSRLRAGGSA
jgi:hypothetical protein